MVIRVSEHTEVISGSPTVLGASAGPVLIIPKPFLEVTIADILLKILVSWL